MTPSASDPHSLCIDCRFFRPADARCAKRPTAPKANMVRLNPNLCGPEAKLFARKPNGMAP